MKDLVSIIITCYNHEKYIAQCLNSVFSQTYSNIELLIINDGSTDDSSRIITELLPSSPYENTEFLSQENAGICFVRNQGLEWAKGEFILFVDSDNYLDNDYVEKLISTAQNEQADIVYTDLFDVDANDVFMEAKEFDLESYLSSNYIDNCSLIRTSKIKDSRYDIELNRKKLVDYDFIMNMILMNGAAPKKCHDAKLNYRVLNDSISRKGNHVSERFYFEVYLYILSKYISKFPMQVMGAVKENILTLSDRLSDLIQHLEEVTNHIHNQEHNLINLSEQIEELNKEIIIRTNEQEQVNLEKLKLVDENTMMANTNQHLTNVVSMLEVEKNQILNSKSFKVGNSIIKPLKLGAKILRNPRLIGKGIRKTNRFLVRKTKQLPSPKTILLKQVRDSQRKKNNYNHPSRVLIFVIYEDQERLQRYKLFFLNALAEIVDNVLIVVNGSLPESDIQELSKIGHVELRSNQGYDTAAFRYGINYFGKEQLIKYDELLLVNDTNVGPIGDFSPVFSKMAEKKLDFWGISYGEEQNDFTQYNKYGFIPIHLQSYFLIIEKSLLNYNGFYDYWASLDDTDSRNKAIGKHETVFTKHFEDLGFKHGALNENNEDSPMYIHPLKMVKEGVPLIKYTAFSNYNNDKFAWQGLLRETEIPDLIEYIKSETSYPIEIIEQIMADIKNKKAKEHILIIDGVENAIPQLTKYRVQNKIEQLESLGYDVWSVNLSSFQMGYAEHASHIVIYRAPLDNKLIDLIHLARKYNKVVLYDIDDLVIDTQYTDQLTYVKELPASEKQNYDNGVISYGEMLKLCDGVVTSTQKMQSELLNYKDLVLLNRNLANKELVELSQKVMKNYDEPNEIVKIGYFSGSITHNENFELVKDAIIKLLEKYDNLELHLVGHLDLPDDMKPFSSRIKTHPFVPWQKLPQLISEVDINIAPLVNSIFNEAKSEIKWIEAALVKVPTVASNIGAFKEMIIDGETGILVNDADWFEKLDRLVQTLEDRKCIATKAYEYVLKHTITVNHEDELTKFLRSQNNESN
ncbi:rhamnan synthesis F family protein [Enterococcus quebecensis]|uniref:Glycosyl transferase n=1 Tax=Enterococcus quebecensis TaxID=903983 RepID=A0A1E5GWS5_9ENTE|nr:rhamnan synthesis F family protein [Enterococcus quebecensis]OEG17168.1 glycosyl transferase [Enterococcus quebecensis]